MFCPSKYPLKEDFVKINTFFHINEPLSVIIFRYLLKEIYSALLVSTLVVLLVLIASQFIHYLDDAANGIITFATVLKIMSLQVPLLLGYLLPLGLFLGILLGLSRLCVDSELMVMFACGVSKTKLLGMIGGISVLIVLLISWLMLWEEPKIQHYRLTILTHAMQNLTTSKIIPSRFQVFDHGINDRWVFYVKSMDRTTHQMQDVFFAHKVIKKDGQVQWDILTSDRADEVYQKIEKGRFLVFQHGYRTIGTPSKKDYQVIQYEKYGMRLDLMKSPKTTHHEVKYWTTRQLLPLIFKRSDAAAEFHWRLAMPISAMILAVIALSFSYTNPRLGRFARFFPAILIYITYGNLLFIGREWLDEHRINILWGLWWVHLIFLAVAVLLLGQYLGWWLSMYRKITSRYEK
jgi:lipopolysaccharide export system permease protein